MQKGKFILDMLGNKCYDGDECITISINGRAPGGSLIKQTLKCVDGKFSFSGRNTYSRLLPNKFVKLIGGNYGREQI